MIKFRPARPGDVAGISSVVMQVWGQAADASVCLAQINNDACAIWVAVENGEVAGFVSAFLTMEAGGQWRWEIDLLAVRSASRGQQLGQQLIASVLREAQKHRADIARALIRVDNIASQKSFTRTGFTSNKRVYKLFLWPPEASEAATIPPDISFFPVDTLTYRGLWLEGLTAPGVSATTQVQAVTAAMALIARQGRENAGALIPIDEENCLPTTLRMVAAMHGEYHWWQKINRNRLCVIH